MRDCWARSVRKARSRETIVYTVDATKVVTVAITATWRHSMVGYSGAPTSKSGTSRARSMQNSPTSRCKRRP